MDKKDTIFIQQLAQVFEYAEVIARLNSALELLDREGYYGEKEVIGEIEKLKGNIQEKMLVHLENSQISSRAMILVNNMIANPSLFRQ
jgi:hypothetical protein